jgi:thioredoxin 1
MKIKKVIPIVLLIIAVVAVVEMKNRKANSRPDGCPDGLCTLPIPADKMVPGEVSRIPESNGVATAENPLPRLVELGSKTCIPCKAMAPIIDKLREAFAGQLEVVFIDVKKNAVAADPYNIRLIPTQVFLDDEGKELFRHEGFYSWEDILAKWKELGYGFVATD